MTERILAESVLAFRPEEEEEDNRRVFQFGKDALIFSGETMLTLLLLLLLLFPIVCVYQRFEYILFAATFFEIQNR